MTQWYYSDAHRNRHGPVSAEELAALHCGGQLQPDSLVWRDGLDGWVPWHTQQAAVVPPDAPPVAPTPLAEDDGRWAVRPAEPASPYAPPQAPVGQVPVAAAETDVVPAGLWKRFAAAVIDGLVLLPVLFLLVYLLGLGESDPEVLSLESLLTVSVASLYFALLQSRPAGASLGKMATGIKVVRGDGTPMTFARALARGVLVQALGLFLRGVPLFLSGLVVPVTRRQQAPHDLLLDTVVVDKHAFTPDAHLQNPNLNGATIAVLALFVLVFLLAVVAGALGLGAAFLSSGGSG